MKFLGNLILFVMTIVGAVLDLAISILLLPIKIVFFIVCLVGAMLSGGGS
jgi:hypothetical protein